MKVIILLLFAISFCLVVFSCDDRSPVSSILDLNTTPMENEEAELAAMWLSGELVAPVKLYEQIRDELFLIRSTWQDSVTETGIVFVPFLRASYLSMGFSSATYDSILAGTYHAWDSLNSYYRMEDMSFIEMLTHVSMIFEGRLNPILLAEAYSGLPGSRYIQAGGFVGDMPLLWIYNARGKLKYFFRNAWGDCPAGCIYSTFNYFEVVDDSAIHRGSWYPEYPPDYDNAPVWFDTVLMARDNYYYHK